MYAASGTATVSTVAKVAELAVVLDEVGGDVQAGADRDERGHDGMWL